MRGLLLLFLAFAVGCQPTIPHTDATRPVVQPQAKPPIKTWIPRDRCSNPADVSFDIVRSDMTVAPGEPPLSTDYPVRAMIGHGRVALRYEVDGTTREMLVEELELVRQGAYGAGERIAREGSGLTVPDGLNEELFAPAFSQAVGRDELARAAFIIQGARAWFVYAVYILTTADACGFTVWRQDWTASGDDADQQGVPRAVLDIAAHELASDVRRP